GPQTKGDRGVGGVADRGELVELIERYGCHDETSSAGCPWGSRCSETLDFAFRFCSSGLLTTAGKTTCSFSRQLVSLMSSSASPAAGRGHFLSAREGLPLGRSSHSPTTGPLEWPPASPTTTPRRWRSCQRHACPSQVEMCGRSPWRPT